MANNNDNVTDPSVLLDRLRALIEEHCVDRYIVILEVGSDVAWRVNSDKFWAVGALDSVRDLTIHDFIEDIRGEEEDLV